MRIRLLAYAIAATALFQPATAQMRNNTEPTMRCEERRDSRDRAQHCEIREQTVPYTGTLTVDGRTNGGVSIKGWNRGDVLVRMKISANARDEAAARAIVGQVRVNLGAGRIAADGPTVEGDGGWSVTYEIFTPHQSNIEATTHNGGVHISDIAGNLRFSAVNGGIHLNRIGGKVEGKTTNGGVHIELAGERWQGEGLEVSTTNGGVHLSLPANYSARLDTSTVNGGLQSDYPLTVSGKIGKQLSATLGSGGATLRVTTTNGGVKIRQI